MIDDPNSRLQELNTKLNKLNLPEACLDEEAVENYRISLLKQAKSRGIYFSQKEVSFKI